VFRISVLLEVESLKIKKETNMATPFRSSNHGLELGGMAVFIPGGAVPDKSRIIREDRVRQLAELQSRQSASSEEVGRVATIGVEVSLQSEVQAS
jgi:hypothetical protein